MGAHTWTSLSRFEHKCSSMLGDIGTLYYAYSGTSTILQCTRAFVMMSGMKIWWIEYQVHNATPHHWCCWGQPWPRTMTRLWLWLNAIIKSSNSHNMHNSIWQLPVECLAMSYGGTNNWRLWEAVVLVTKQRILQYHLNTTIVKNWSRNS